MRSKTAKRRKVALLVETSNAYGRGLLEGVAGYLKQGHPWSIYLAEHERGDRPPPWLSKWDGDGILARVENKAIARAVKAAKLPVIDVSAAGLLKDTPWVETDDEAIARMALDHLLDRGFSHVGFSGNDAFNWSKWREQAFMRLAADAGVECHVHQAQEPADWEERVSDLAAWLKGVPKPIGIMACYDIRGVRVLEACRRIGLSVPDDVAVIGVDNDEVLCKLADPPLSSVASDTYRTGYLAAELLDKMMSGRKVKADAHLIQPIQIVSRQSTDVVAVEDLHIAAAIRYIRDHACEGIQVPDVVSQVPLSRRALETRFKLVVGRSPHEEIDRVKLNRVKELLRGTDLPIDEIADRCGYRHSEYLSTVFKRRVGVPPGEFRRSP